MNRARKYNTYAPGARGPLQVLVGGVWRPLPKMRNVQFAPQTPTETAIEYVDEPTETRSGQSGPGTATVDITRAPALAAYRACRDAFRDGQTVLRFRDWGGEAQTEDAAAAGETLAVTTAGVGTLVGANAGSPDEPASKFRPGKLVFPYHANGPQANAQVLVIESVTGALGLTVSRYGTVSQVASTSDPAIATEDDEDLAAVTPAARYTISSYATMREFEGKVTNLGGYSRGADDSGQVDQLMINVIALPSDQAVIAPVSTS